MVTLPETNIALEKWWLEDYSPFGMVYFQGSNFQGVLDGENMGVARWASIIVYMEL